MICVGAQAHGSRVCRRILEVTASSGIGWLTGSTHETNMALVEDCAFTGCGSLDLRPTG